MKSLLLILAAAAVSAPAQAAWYNASWQYRKAISIPAGRVLGSPPMLVDLSGDLDVAARARADCHDVLFTSADGTTRLAHEVDTCRATPCDRTSTAFGHCFLFHVGGALTVGSADSVIFVYFGNPYASDQSNVAAVWPSGYENVYHFTGGSLTDSSTHARTCTLSGTSDVQQGLVGDALFYNRLTYLDCATAATFSSGYTYEFLANSVNEAQTSNAKDYPTNPNPGLSTSSVFLASPHSGTTGAFMFRWDTYGPAGPAPYMGTTNLVGGDVHAIPNYMAAAKWYYVAVTWDGNTSRLYLNGSLYLSQSIASISAAGTILIGGTAPIYNVGSADCKTGICFQGWIDELRISSVARSAAYIATQWSNMYSPADFYEIGVLEVRP